MASTSQDIAPDSAKSLLNQDGSVTKLIEAATANVTSVEDVLDLFLSEGVAVSHGEELTGDYAVIHSEEKQAFCQRIIGKRLIVVAWDFYEGENGEFVAMHAVVDGAGKFIINDGSQGGMYGQLRQITDNREANDPATAGNRSSRAGLMVARGIRLKPDFYYYMNSDDKTDERNGRAIPKRELADVPEKYRRKANPVWQFDL